MVTLIKGGLKKKYDKLGFLAEPRLTPTPYQDILWMLKSQVWTRFQDLRANLKPHGSLFEFLGINDVGQDQ